jgi:hypothetical protein
MSWINVGCKIGEPADWCPSKKAMKDALRESPVDVMFIGTALLDTAQWSGRGSEIPIGVKLSVCGPDPFTQRRWHATVTRSADGRIRVE